MRFLIFEKGRYLLTPMRLTFKILFSFIVAFIVLSSLKAQSVKNFDIHQPFSFEENKGQIADPNVLYYGKSNGTTVYCFKDHIAFVFEKISVLEKKVKAKFINPKIGDHINDSLIITASRLEMQFERSSPAVSIIAEAQQQGYNNYYLQSCPNGVTTRSYDKLTYKNLYPGVDMVLEKKEQGLEYSYIIYPGSRVDNIKMHWQGNDSFSYNQPTSAFKISNSLGFLQESNLHAFQDEQEIQCRYRIDGNSVSFIANQYDLNKPLVIDPKIIWGTMFGGEGYDRGLAVARDKNGNVCITGYTGSTTKIASSGAFQTTAGGDLDIFVARFSATGKRLWGTFWGDAGKDYGYGIAVDTLKNLYITGSSSSHTSSTSTGLATKGAFQTSHTNGDAALIAKFDSSGNRKWCSYFGDGATIGFAVTTDAFNNIYFTGQVLISSMSLASSGAYQTTTANIFLAKFSSLGSRIWSTYFGGSSNSVDAAYGITMDTSNSVIITGQGSTTGMATSGTYQTSPQGGRDAFLAKFSKTGNLIWGTYYGGSGFDYAFGVTADKFDNIYVTGYSQSNSNIASTGTYQTSCNGKADAFVAKFSTKGNRIWGSYLGGLGDDEGLGIAADTSGNAYIVGFSKSSNIANSGLLFTSFPSPSSGFISQFTQSGKKAWVSYFAGSNSEVTGIAFDTLKSVYITGFAYAGFGTSNSYQSGLGGNSDAFLFKIDFRYPNDAGVTKILNPVRNFCPVTKVASIILKNFGTAELDSVRINWSLNGILQKTYHWKGKLLSDSTTNVIIDTFKFTAGYDTLRAWTSLPNGVQDSVPENDSSKEYFIVYPSPNVNAGGNHAICYGNGIQIGSKADSSLKYSWTSKPSGFLDTTSNPGVSPKITTTYYLTVTNKVTGCTATDSTIITVNPLPLAKTGPGKTICLGDSTRLGDSAVSGHGYTWFRKGVAVLGTTSKLTVSPTTTTTYYLTESINATGCTKTDSVTVNVISFPAHVVKSHSTCFGSTTTIGAAPVANHRYAWTSKPIGFTSSQSNPTVSPKVNTTYYLTETDSIYGCSHSDSVRISVNPLPKPNAGTDTVICAGSYVVLGSTQPSRYSYYWTSLPAGFTSTSRAVSVSPADSTRYIVTATDSNGCSNRDTVFIKVNPLPKAYIGAKGICPGDSIQLGASPIAGHTYQWGSSIGGFSSTLPNPVVRPTTATTYYLNETNTVTGCSKTDSATVFINPVPKTANIGDKDICQGDKIAIGGNPVTGSTYTWTSNPIGFTSNVANPIVSPTVTTAYYITETNATGCVKSDSLTITVKPIPAKPFAGSDKRICAGDTTTLSFSSVSGSTYRWTNTSGTYSSTDSVIRISPAATTVYVLTNTSKATGCSNSDSVTVTVIPLPTPKIKGQFSFCGTDAGTYTTPFQDSTNYEWTISNGKILSGQFTNSVSVQWLDTGAASIAVKETNSNGCHKLDTALVRINPKPRALFIGYNACQGESIQFTDSSSFAATYTWSFGDGNNSVQQSPAHSYTKSGTYSVKELIITKAGCKDSFIRTINVYPLPKGQFIILHDTGRLYNFSVTDSTERAYHWSFGDGDSSNTANPYHNYQDSKPFSVHLTIKNSNGCIQELDTTINSSYYTDKDSISIFPNPFAGHISIYERLKENTTFRLLIYDAIGQKVADLSQWTRDAGIHTDTFDAVGLAQGTYIVKLIVGDDEVIVRKMVKVGR